MKICFVATKRSDCLENRDDRFNLATVILDVAEWTHETRLWNKLNLELLLAKSQLRGKCKRQDLAPHFQVSYKKDGH